MFYEYYCIFRCSNIAPLALQSLYLTPGISTILQLINTVRQSLPTTNEQWPSSSLMTLLAALQSAQMFNQALVQQ